MRRRAMHDARRHHRRDAGRTEAARAGLAAQRAERCRSSGRSATRKKSGSPPAPGQVLRQPHGPSLPSRTAARLTCSFPVGWAGALTAECAAGVAHNVAGVIDVRTGERFSCDAGAGELWLATSPKVADEAEKRRLAATYKAEPGRHGSGGDCPPGRHARYPFLLHQGRQRRHSTKNLPDLNRFLTPDGRFQTVRFALFALIRPWHWHALVRMGENSRKASQSIAKSLLELLDERGHMTKRNGYPNHQT